MEPNYTNFYLYSALVYLVVRLNLISEQNNHHVLRINVRERTNSHRPKLISHKKISLRQQIPTISMISDHTT